jgi:hypothetical protein
MGISHRLVHVGFAVSDDTELTAHTLDQINAVITCVSVTSRRTQHQIFQVAAVIPCLDTPVLREISLAATMARWRVVALGDAKNKGKLRVDKVINSSRLPGGNPFQVMAEMSNIFVPVGDSEILQEAIKIFWEYVDDDDHLLEPLVRGF